MIEDLSGVRQQKLAIYDNQMSHFAQQMLATSSDRTNVDSMHMARGAKKTKKNRNLFARIEAFEEMEHTSIRSGVGGVVSNDDVDSIMAPPKDNFGFKRSTFARKYQTEVRGIEKDFSDSSDF